MSWWNPFSETTTDTQEHDGLPCPDCGSRWTAVTQSWTGYQQTTGPMVTVDQHSCNACGNRWMD